MAKDKIPTPAERFKAPLVLPFEQVPKATPPKFLQAAVPYVNDRRGTGDPIEVKPFDIADFFQTTGHAIRKAEYAALVLDHYAALVLSQEACPAIDRFGEEVALAQAGLRKFISVLTEFLGDNVHLETDKRIDGTTTTAIAVRKNPKSKGEPGRHIRNGSGKDVLVDPSLRPSLV